MKTSLDAFLTRERSDMLAVWTTFSTAVCRVQCWSTALCTEGCQPCPVKGWEARAACREERMSSPGVAPALVQQREQHLGDDQDLAGHSNRVAGWLSIHQVLSLARQHLADQQAAPVAQADHWYLTEVDPSPQVPCLTSLVARGNGRDIKVVFCDSVDTLQTGSVEQLTLINVLAESTNNFFLCSKALSLSVKFVECPSIVMKIDLCATSSRI